METLEQLQRELDFARRNQPRVTLKEAQQQAERMRRARRKEVMPVDMPPSRMEPLV